MYAAAPTSEFSPASFRAHSRSCTKMISIKLAQLRACQHESISHPQSSRKSAVIQRRHSHLVTGKPSPAQPVPASSPNLPPADPTSHSRSPSAAASFSSSATAPRFRDMSLRAGAQNVVLLPGWAQRKVARDRHPQGWATVDAPEGPRGRRNRDPVSIHGFASKVLDSPSRSQRIFNQMARQLAGLPRYSPSTPIPACFNLPSHSSTNPKRWTAVKPLCPRTPSHPAIRIAPKGSHASSSKTPDDETLVRLMETSTPFPPITLPPKKAAQVPATITSRSTKTSPPSARLPDRHRPLRRLGTVAQSQCRRGLLVHHNLSRRLHDYWVYRLPHHDVFIEISR